MNYVAYEAKWYAAIEARVTPITTISGTARRVDGDTVVIVGLLLAKTLCAAAALVLSVLHWKAQEPGQRDHLKKDKPLDGLLRDGPWSTALKKLRNLFRRRLTPGEIQRLEQRSHTRL